MPNALLAAQSRAVLSAYARGMGLDAEVFENGELTIAERPGHAPWPYLAMAISCPGGTALSVAPELLDFANANHPEVPYQAAQIAYLHRLGREAESRGLRVNLDGPNICWALGTAAEVPALPADLHFTLRDADWMNSFLESGEFPNGIGETGVNARDVRNRYAVAVEDANGTPVAVAGAFDSFGLMEVGIDVSADRQGEGLGIAAVAALVREILARGETPLYGCAATNIRSQRTARSAGFVPVFSDATIDLRS